MNGPQHAQKASELAEQASAVVERNGPWAQALATCAMAHAAVAQVAIDIVPLMADDDSSWSGVLS